MQILFLVALVPCFIYYLLKGTKTLHMLQQNWYNEGNRYIRWILENKYKVFIDPDMFFVIFIVSIFTAYKASLVLFITDSVEISGNKLLKIEIASVSCALLGEDELTTPI